MDHPEILFLLSQLRCTELREQAVQNRLTKLVRKNRPGSRSSGTKINDWVRAHLLENSNREDLSLEHRRISDPGCIASET